MKHRGYFTWGCSIKHYLSSNQALTTQEERLGNNHPQVAKMMNNLGAVYMRIGDYQAAEQMLRQALDIFRKTLGDQHPDVSGVLNNLSLVCFKISTQR